MKTHLRFSLALLATLTVGMAATAMAANQSAPDGKKFYMVVAAERTDQAAKPALPTPDHPAYYVAYDAGYIEAGDPVGGEEPAPAAAVAQALRGTLASQNYLPASAPSLLIVYHWGVIRPDSHQIRDTFNIQPNLKARIALVATSRQAGEIENFLLERRMGRISPAFRVPNFLPGPERDLLDLAQDDRYFVIVSAYDYAALTRRETKLLWRLKVSTRSPGESMAEALPALLSGGAPYLGRNLNDTQTLKAPLFPAALAATGAAGAAGAQEFLPPPEVARQLDESYMRHLIHEEYLKFSGDIFSGDKGGNYPPPPTAANASGESFLPPALAARINAYEQEKSTLQDALTARIKERTPGADTRQAIDAFNQENAGRIASLTKEREAIRDELAKLAAANTDAATGKSLNALQKEFAAGVQEMETPPTPASK
jgi:hypothetical protein